MLWIVRYRIYDEELIHLGANSAHSEAK